MLGRSAQLQELLTQQVHEMFTTKFAEVDPARLSYMCRRVYLSVIDKYWMEHIDEMQYLREKVGLYGYAQIDPLVVYKKESYDKFQRLLSTIKKETLGELFRIDVASMQHAQQSQPVLTVNKSLNMVDLLKSVTSRLKTPTRPVAPQATLSHSSASAQDDSDVQVLEVDDEKDLTDTTVVHATHKRRPNDKVSVRYPDGRIVETKYKKVKDEIEAGQATLL